MLFLFLYFPTTTYSPSEIKDPWGRCWTESTGAVSSSQSWKYQYMQYINKIFKKSKSKPYGWFYLNAYEFKIERKCKLIKTLVNQKFSILPILIRNLQLMETWQEKFTLLGNFFSLISKWLTQRIYFCYLFQFW